ncbi:hypothetical protein D915_001677 [Fasciola hepatica]|uniref:Small ribosomal subunit protein mS26 n=1 Tax=Fasciola hepatica TaxID=6192 RepID=A0A4E0RP90_FASHE|nr:hypothetical protein D915_001677 [Fasciola hepatica]
MSKLSAFVKNTADLGHKATRKNPRIYPKAKTKRFNVRQPVPIDPEENKLLTQWWSDYRLRYNAVIDLLTYELKVKESVLTASIRRDDEGDRKRRWEVNESWNKETRAHSRPALEMMLNELAKEKQHRLVLFEQKAHENIMANMTKIEELAAASEHLVTWENLDEKIEEIFNSPVVDYNFLVDQHGKVVHGSSPLPHPSDAKKSDEGLPNLSSTDDLSVTV